MERAIETQRLKLLRLLAGLIVALGFLSVGPVSRSFSAWVCGYVGSILSRAELAARYLVIAQARVMAARHGLDVAHSRFSESLAVAVAAPETDISVADCRARLRALQAVLSDLPRHALRLLRRIDRQMRCATCADRPSLRPDARLSIALRDWRLAGNRIERPPDDDQSAPPLISPPSGFRAGGAGGSAFA